MVQGEAELTVTIVNEEGLLLKAIREENAEARDATDRELIMDPITSGPGVLKTMAAALSKAMQMQLHNTPQVHVTVPVAIRLEVQQPLLPLWPYVLAKATHTNH